MARSSRQMKMLELIQANDIEPGMVLMTIRFSAQSIFSTECLNRLEILAEIDVKSL